MIAITGACGAPLSNGVKDETVSQGVTMNPNHDMPVPPGGAPVNQRFATLDDYLTWLRTVQAPVDGPWYEEVRPGVFQLRTGNLRILGPGGDETPRNQTFSRAELEKKFGFSR